MGVILLAGMEGIWVARGLIAPTLGMTGLIVMTFLLNTIIYMYVCYASAVYVPEMWPTSAKLSGSGFSNAMGRVSNIFFPFLVTNVAASSMGSGGVFILIAIVAAIIAVAVIFLGVETRGESVENIGDVEYFCKTLYYIQPKILDAVPECIGHRKLKSLVMENEIQQF